MRSLIKCLVFNLFVFTLCNVHGQENLLYKKVLEAKSLGIIFDYFPSVFVRESDNKATLSSFMNPGEVSFLKYNNITTKDLSKAIILRIPTKGKEIELELLEVPTSILNYEVVTEGGKRFPANKNFRHYRGIVKDNPSSIVAISFLENEVMGLVATDEGNFNLVSDANLSQYIFYNRSVQNK